MLMLSRKRNEEIVINDQIRVVVCEIRGDRVRLGIDAPRETPVDRREIADAKRQTIEGKEVRADGTRPTLPE